MEDYNMIKVKYSNRNRSQRYSRIKRDYINRQPETNFRKEPYDNNKGNFGCLLIVIILIIIMYFVTNNK